MRVTRATAMVVGLFLATGRTVLAEPVIVGVSIPEDSTDQHGSHASIDDVWTVSAPPYPLDVGTGIGFIVNPAPATYFSLHDHVYVPPFPSHVPDPTRAVVTYEFDRPTVVDQIEVIQHTNGISLIEGYVGDSLGDLTSVGSVFGPYGDSSGFAEGESYVFDFGNLLPGTFFQFVIRKTSAAGGYAAYQCFPRDAEGNRFLAAPEPPPLPGDATGDGRVDVFDLASLANNYRQWGRDWGDGDFTGDGYVGVDDLAILANNYQRGTGGGGLAVPEPGTVSAFVVGGLALLWRRRRQAGSGADAAGGRS